MDYGLEIRKISSDLRVNSIPKFFGKKVKKGVDKGGGVWYLSLIHISEPTRH